MEEVEKKSGSAVDSLTVKSILALLSEERMIELFDVLEMTIPERPHGIREKIDELVGKYFELVWLARKDPEEFAGKDFYEKVAQKYPKELLKLQDPNNGDWQHGFNSGMLACARLLTAYALPRKHGELVDRGPNSYSPPLKRPVEVVLPDQLTETAGTPIIFSPSAVVSEPLPDTNKGLVPAGFELKSMLFPGNLLPTNVLVPTMPVHVTGSTGEIIKTIPYTGPLFPGPGSETDEDDDDYDSDDDDELLIDPNSNEGRRTLLPVPAGNPRIFEFPFGLVANPEPFVDTSSSSDEREGLSMGDDDNFYSRVFQIKIAEKEFPDLDT
jgi:hypothetical protein